MNLEIWQNGQIVQAMSCYISVSGVEKMYRWVNLRHVVGQSETRATDVTQPVNNPDWPCLELVDKCWVIV